LHRNTALVREDFGLSETAPLLLLPQAPYKLHPHMDVWLNEVLHTLLAQEPHTRLLVPQAPEPAWTQALKERWQQSLSPAALAAVHWVQPLRPADWQQLVALSDVVLDSWPCSDLSAAVEALGLGTPVLTLQGHSLKNRQVAGVYQALGLAHEGFIAPSPAAWVQQALAYLQQPKAQRLQQKQRVQQAALPLFSHAQHTAASQTLAKALHHLWQAAIAS
jgi:predicted O-linked N-acetylglucosamine transferase (SPINDLY family)